MYIMFFELQQLDVRFFFPFPQEHKSCTATEFENKKFIAILHQGTSREFHKRYTAMACSSMFQHLPSIIRMTSSLSSWADSVAQ
ncbi:hypothetical protein GDO86_009482 [Hymenochirus boettgeri]|uniref:Uncharacterized protein n=1 Tax=Hymenochirus boettgeri TaxID=247094 RepID=A0A8T2JLB9_9PIPI|nr:hypothetical protein GDO86_009482 [Hymenochirus boettgeri]